MKIDAVVISCYPFDLHLTRLCVASIRFWYPDLPIWLLKDRHHGDFDTSELQRYWGAQVYPTAQQTQGWGFGKLEVMTEPTARRFLFLDSDIVFVGRVIDRLEQFDHDFIVDYEDFPPDAVPVQFFPLDKLCQFDPSFTFPGYGFNGGQIVATTGSISRADFDALLDWQSRSVTHPEIFQKGDQGLTNYVVLRKIQRGQLTIHREDFMAWPGQLSRTAHIHLHELTPDSPHPQLMHWAGLGWGKPLDQMPRADILLHFEALYYSRIPRGSALRRLRNARAWANRSVVIPLKVTANRLLHR